MNTYSLQSFCNLLIGSCLISCNYKIHNVLLMTCKQRINIIVLHSNRSKSLMTIKTESLNPRPATNKYFCCQSKLFSWGYVHVQVLMLNSDIFVWMFILQWGPIQTPVWTSTAQMWPASREEDGRHTQHAVFREVNMDPASIHAVQTIIMKSDESRMGKKLDLPSFTWSMYVAKNSRKKSRKRGLTN